MARFERNRHDTFIETRTIPVAQQSGDPPADCVVHLEIDVGVILGWMATRALKNKSHFSKHLSGALRVSVRPVGE